MKITFTLLIYLLGFSLFAQTEVKILSWNLKDFGTSKSDTEILVIANTVKFYDLIAIQEVVAGLGGAQAVARLSDELNRTGEKWEYTISDVTSGSSAHKAERYAFLWKKNAVTLIGKAWLEQTYGRLIEREPFFGRFKIGQKFFTLASYHAIPKSKQPETEIKYFKFLPDSYPDDDLIFCGDFNLPQSHTVFNPLKKLGILQLCKGRKLP